MPTKRFAVKHWKMVLVLIAICGAMLLLRWAAMIWGQGRRQVIRRDVEKPQTINGPTLSSARFYYIL